MGRQVNRLTWDDVDKHIQRLQIALTNDSIEWLVRYEETHQEIIWNTLFQYGIIHIIDISLLDELDLIEAKLDQKIPDFEFVDLEGDSITSEDLEGKVVLRGIVGGLIEEVDEGIVEEHQLMWDELRVMMDQLLKE